MADVTYTTAAGIWRRSGFVAIVSVLGTRIAVFPMDFLATCGDNTWGYVLFAITCVIDIDPQHPGSIIDDQDRPVDLEAAPVGGTVSYVETGMPEVVILTSYTHSFFFEAKVAMLYFREVRSIFRMKSPLLA